MSICTDPDLLKIMYIVNNLITIIKIGLPLFIIVKATLDMVKLTLNGEMNYFKEAFSKISIRLIAAVLIFFIPTIVNVIFGFIEDRDFISCLTETTMEDVKAAYVRRADLSVALAERSLEKRDYDTAYSYVYSLEDGVEKDNYIKRLQTLKITIDDQKKTFTNIIPSFIKPSSNNLSGNGKLAVVNSYYSSGKGVAHVGVRLNTEPDPSAAINYWSNYINTDDFIYPKDSITGKSLGAWPKNYASIPTQLTGYKTYQNDTFIFPVTPTNESYHFVYNHNGIDIMAPIGSPVYSPVDGTIQYSTWGHTVNRGGDETAYSISIFLDRPIKYENITIGQVFLTHMSGIRYRCDKNCTQKVKKGELLGFTGNAAGTAESIGYAPHLHMTIHEKYKYSSSIWTNKIETFYGIPTGTSDYKIKAGG